MDYEIPLYIQLKEMILQRIADGEYLPGEKIPSEREMAAIYKINRNTVKNAINALVEEGILYKVKNTGVYVTKSDNQRMYYFKNSSNEISSTSLGAILKLSGHTVESDVLEKGIVSGRKYIEYKLDLEPGESAYALHRLRKIEGNILALEFSYLPYKYFPGIDEHNFKNASLYAYMDTLGHCPVQFEQKMIVEKPRRPFKKVMDLQDDDFVYAMEHIGRDADNNIVEFTKTFLKCEYGIYTFAIESK